MTVGNGAGCFGRQAGLRPVCGVPAVTGMSGCGGARALAMWVLGVVNHGFDASDEDLKQGTKTLARIHKIA